MTKEELEKEAEDYAEQCYGWTNNDLALDVAKATYITSAEPREKRVEELEKACEETQELLDKQIEATYKLDKENAELKEKLKTAYRKGMRHMAKALKDYDRTDGAWTDYFEHTVDKVLQIEQVHFEEYGTLAEQLTKAKELLKESMNYLDTYHNAVKVYNFIAEAEQFIRDSEVEK